MTGIFAGIAVRQRVLTIAGFYWRQGEPKQAHYWKNADCRRAGWQAAAHWRQGYKCS